MGQFMSGTGARGGGGVGGGVDIPQKYMACLAPDSIPAGLSHTM